MTNMKDRVSIQVGLSGYSYTPKFTLVPSGFYNPEKAWEMLSEVVDLEINDRIEAVEMPEFNAVLLYSGAAEGVCFMLKSLLGLQDYNKIAAAYHDGYLYLAIAQGRSLMLCNSFKAQDFTTAEYFIFMALKKLQLNPEVSTIYFRTELDEEQEMSLYRYFKNVDKI